MKVSSAVQYERTSDTEVNFGGPAGSSGVTWDTLADDEQDLILAASTDGPLWALCDSRSAVELHSAAGRLVARGLIWFYLLEDGYPDLTPAQVCDVCTDPRWWDVGGTRCYEVGVYLTEAGESVFPSFPDGVTR